MGMDLDELLRRDREYSGDLNQLCDDLYAAIDQKLRGPALAAVLDRGKKKLAAYEALTSELKGAQLESFVKSTRSATDEIREFVKQIEAGG